MLIVTYLFLVLDLYAVQSRTENVKEDVKSKVEAALGKVGLKLSGLFDATTLGNKCQYDDETLQKLLKQSFPNYEK